MSKKELSWSPHSQALILVFLGLPYLFFLILKLYLKSSGMHIVEQSPSAVLSSQSHRCGRKHQKSHLKAELSAPEQVSEGLYHSFPSFTTRAVLAIFHRKRWKFSTFLMGATLAMQGRCSPKYVIASKQPRVLFQLTNIDHDQNSSANDFFLLPCLVV